jgi:hypothetical protein
MQSPKQSAVKKFFGTVLGEAGRPRGRGNSRA